MQNLFGLHQLELKLPKKTNRIELEMGFFIPLPEARENVHWCETYLDVIVHVGRIAVSNIQFVSTV